MNGPYTGVPARWRPESPAVYRRRHMPQEPRTCPATPPRTSATSCSSATAGAGRPRSPTRCCLRRATAVPQRSVADGTSFSDFEKEEKEHKHSIYSVVLHVDHLGKRINLIDTPGSPDLIGPAIACLPAVETVAVVVNATSGSRSSPAA